MSLPILEITNLSKQYRLGYVGTGSLGHDINRWWQTSIRGKEDPYLKIGEENNRSQVGNSEYVWALRDINLQVQAGEVLGIIGANGAGKSTLLKILSRVTGPSTGSIKTRGRIASLLEVGTGFHGELTGRENIYLNGAILGMTKQEITSKLDEIIDFSGCERYIDTPVKRYSSGMYVRLAFAVAAHLEPEILIVDEVLAVGDAEFQKKAIGKMKDISSGQGRTVLFVSHNMTSVETLCERGVVMENGKVLFDGNVNKAVSLYLKNETLTNVYKRNWDYKAKDASSLYVGAREVKILSDERITINSEIIIECIFDSYSEQTDINISFHLYTVTGILVFVQPTEQFRLIAGKYVVKFKLPKELLNCESYTISILFVKNFQEHLWLKNVLCFDVSELTRNIAWFGKWSGVVRPKINWEINEANF